MCGVNGLFCFDGSAGADESVLISMRDTMISRGPDGAGVWVSPDKTVGFGHRRLSIIDLADLAGQPMSAADGRVTITYNGEIYNHLALRKELQTAGHTFITDHSDTEVLIHGFEQWGIEGLLQRIEGMFGFGLWDDNDKKLYLVRDRVGVKPLYFSTREGKLLFASEIKAILAYPGFVPDIDPVAMSHYLSFMTTPAPLTMFSGVFKLPGGTYLSVVRGGEIVSTRYWDAIPSGEVMNGADDRSHVYGVLQKLTESVEKRMMSDVGFGAFLSGGVDSTTNVALMSRYTDRPVKTFTVGFSDHKELNELDHARYASKLFATEHHEVLIKEDDMTGYIDSLVHHQDEPIADWVCVPLYFVSKLAKENGVTVVQVGEGADEQFAGYDGYLRYLDLHKKYWTPFNRYTPAFARRLTATTLDSLSWLHPKLGNYAEIAHRAGNDRELFWSGAMVFWDLMKRRLVTGKLTSARDERLIKSGLLPESYLAGDSFSVVDSFFTQLKNNRPDADQLTKMIYSEFRLRLPELLLMRVDKITMSTSVEARVPFLDHKLVEFSMNIPTAQKIAGGRAKNILKEAVKGLIPEEIINRKKVGFGAPMSQWLRSGFGIMAKETTLNSGLMDRGYFDTDFIAGMFDAHMSGKGEYSVQLWTLFNLCSWYDYWIDRR